MICPFFITVKRSARFEEFVADEENTGAPLGLTPRLWLPCDPTR
jgi:hypothetical protein